ncbi:MAG: hypothetical protein U0736_14625 [Gemmataceae bacterium]
MQGPITVFEGSTYAGDARILDLQPNEERLISYAIDLGTEVGLESRPSPDNGRILAVKAYKGMLVTTTRQRPVADLQGEEPQRAGAAGAGRAPASTPRSIWST